MQNLKFFIVSPETFSSCYNFDDFIIFEIYVNNYHILHPKAVSSWLRYPPRLFSPSPIARNTNQHEPDLFKIKSTCPTYLGKGRHSNSIITKMRVQISPLHHAAGAPGKVLLLSEPHSLHVRNRETTPMSQGCPKKPKQSTFQKLGVQVSRPHRKTCQRLTWGSSSQEK